MTGLAAASATTVLWAMTGRRFGLCTVTLRPCRRSCSDYPWPAGFYEWPGTNQPNPALIGGQWFDVVCGSCRGSCACGVLEEVVLPTTVYAVTQVRVDGVPLPAGAYRVDDNRILVRTDGGRWPVCNDLTKDDSKTGTWSVTATYGEPVPELGQLAAGELACEIIRGMGGDDCRLPKNITSLARQGVTIQLPDIGELFTGGKLKQPARLGLYLCDLLIASVNPAGLKTRSRAYSVDDTPPRRTST